MTPDTEGRSRSAPLGGAARRTAARTSSSRLPVPGPGRHVAALDGFRGLAVLLVMAHHFFAFSRYRPEGLLTRGGYEFVYAGWSGVDLFFVLSGFLITGILMETRGRHGYFKVFYARRTLRIFPLYYAFLLGWFFVLPLLTYPGPGFEALRGEQSWYWLYAVNVRIAMDGWPELYDIGHFWSLAVEEQFYLFWPLVVLRFQRRRLGQVCLGIVVASAALRVVFFAAGKPLAAYVLTPCRMDALAIGALLAIALRDPSWWPRVARAARPVLGASLGLLLLIGIYHGGRLDPSDLLTGTAGLSVIAIASAALLVVALGTPAPALVGRFFESRLMKTMGRYSYCLYVVHCPIALLVGRKLFTVRELPAVLGSRLPAALLFVTVCAVISFVVSALSWHLFESRVLTLKKRTRYGAPIVRPSAGRGVMRKSSADPSTPGDRGR